MLCNRIVIFLCCGHGGLTQLWSGQCLQMKSPTLLSVPVGVCVLAFLPTASTARSTTTAHTRKLLLSTADPGRGSTVWWVLFGHGLRNAEGVVEALLICCLFSQDESGQPQSNFSLSITCQFCWQLDPSQYRCSNSTNCMTVSCPRRRYNATCVVLQHVHCLGRTSRGSRSQFSSVRVDGSLARVVADLD